MGFFETPEGVCPDKVRMLTGSDGSYIGALLPGDFVRCEPGCTGSEQKEVKLWKIPLGCIQVCPLDGSDLGVEITEQAETFERPR